MVQGELKQGEQVGRTPAEIVLAFHLGELSLYEARYEMLRGDRRAADINDELLFTKDLAA